MKTQRTKLARPSSRRKADKDNARQRLLEAAGQVFAEKGFEAATAKEICEKAHTNTAAVNYYFGGIEGLYAVVFEEARSRLVSGSEAFAAALADKTDAKDKLEAALGLVVQAATGPAASSWALRVFGREVVAPSFVTDSTQLEDALTRIAILRAIVAELTGLPPDHAAVSHGCISVLAPCWMFLVADRRMLKNLFPNFDLSPENAPVLTRHLVEFALAGLAAVKR